MTESRILVKLIALWIIFIASTGLFFWSGQQFVIAMFKMANGGYQENTYPGGSYYPGPGLASCILPPQYPGMGPMPVSETPIDSATIDKYNQDYQKYSESYQAACKEDVLRQQGTQKKSSITDVASNSFLAFLAIVSAVISLMAIKKTESI